jgi:hypothetical protein
VLCSMVMSTVLLPVTAPLFAYAVIGPALTLSPSALGFKLFALLAGSALVGFIVRWIAGANAIEQHKEAINGFNILVLFVFVAAVMESVATRLLATPMITIGLAALAFVVFFTVLCLTTVVFASAGRERALTVGFMTAQRNVGLMLAASGGALPDLTWLYFAFSYFPIYVSPLLLQPLARWMIARAPDTIDVGRRGNEECQAARRPRRLPAGAPPLRGDRRRGRRPARLVGVRLRRGHHPASGAPGICLGSVLQ